MSSEWRTAQFQHFCEITRGASPRPIQDYLGNEGMPWIKIADATAEPSRFISRTKEKIKLHGVRASVEVFPGDLILSNSATPGVPKFLKIQACIHDGWMLLRNFRDLDIGFAYWLLLAERLKLVAQGNGSVFTNLKTDILKKHVVTVPPISIQLKIAQTLNTLDDRITHLRETNTTLEAIAQALFKSWFVDFDPVHAKMQGLAPEGMDEATARLFPDGLEESELGLVPVGWGVRSFRETIQIIGGGTPKTSNPEFWGGDIPWFSVVDAPAISDVFVVTTEKHITEAGLNGSSTKLLPTGTTIISARGTVGRLALTGCPMSMNQSCYGLRGLAGDNYFTYFSTKRLVEQLKQRAHGSVFDTITQESFAGVLVSFPAEGAIAEFEDLVESLMLRIRKNLMQAQTLATLRDTLLPRLISGQLRLPEVADHLEEALS